MAAAVVHRPVTLLRPRTDATTTLTNCTVSGNSASMAAAAACTNGQCIGTTTLTNCTVSGNSAVVNGGGLDNVVGTVNIGNTIVAGNTATTSGPDALGSVASQGNNLIGETDGSTGWVGSDLTGTIAPPLNPLLAPLGNYGGPTQTMALLPGSPAIDAGNNALIPAGVTTDQRGLPRIVNGIVDIGAFESSGFTIAAVSGSGQSTGVLTAFPNPLVVTVTANNPSEPVAGGVVTIIAAERAGDPGSERDHRRGRHGEHHRHGQRHPRQLHRLGHGQRHHEFRELQPDQRPADPRPRPVGVGSTQPLGQRDASTPRALSMSIPARRVPCRPAATPRSRPRPSTSTAASRSRATPASVRPRSRGPRFLPRPRCRHRAPRG